MSIKKSEKKECYKVRYKYRDHEGNIISDETRSWETKAEAQEVCDRYNRAKKEVFGHRIRSARVFKAFE